MPHLAALVKTVEPVTTAAEGLLHANVEPRLTELKKRIAEGSPRALELLPDIQKWVSRSHVETVKLLTEQVENFEFDEAAETLERLMADDRQASVNGE